MKEKNFMTISEFAHIAGIKRANLIFYDNIGLLSPELRGENNYRYYSRRQLESAYLIASLRELGLGLEEIRHYADKRTPQKMLRLLDEQEQKIQKEMGRLRRMKDMLELFRNMAIEGLDWELGKVILRHQPREPIFLGEPPLPHQSDEEASISFYGYAARQGKELGYPLGSMISKETLETYQESKEQPNVLPVSRYYFKVKHGNNAYKPEGLYAAVCGICGYSQSEFLYGRLLDFVNKNHLRISGDAYEEYLMSEMAIQDENQYYAKIELMVEHC